MNNNETNLVWAWLQSKVDGVPLDAGVPAVSRAGAEHKTVCAPVPTPLRRMGVQTAMALTENSENATVSLATVRMNHGFWPCTHPPFPCGENFRGYLEDYTRHRARARFNESLTPGRYVYK